MRMQFHLFYAVAMFSGLVTSDPAVSQAQCATTVECAQRAVDAALKANDTAQALEKRVATLEALAVGQCKIELRGVWGKCGTGSRPIQGLPGVEQVMEETTTGFTPPRGGETSWSGDSEPRHGRDKTSMLVFNRD
jgi:hypothetical protein